MKRYETKLIIWIIFLTSLVLSFVCGYEVRGESKNLQNNLYRVSNVTQSYENESETLITYHPINQPADSAGIIFDVTLKNLSNQDSSLLISTLSKDSCESENDMSKLPAWKIDTQRRKFRLKINQNTTQDFSGSTLFLCVYNEYLGQMQHLGELSALKISNENNKLHDFSPNNDDVDDR
jgi:hypothetical protein